MVTAVELESGTGGTRTWRSRLSLSRSSREAEVHQLVSVPARRSCLTSRQQHKEGRNFGLTTEPRSIIESRRPWWAVSDYKDIPNRIGS